MLSVSRLVAVIEAHYPPALAENWDRVGLVCGDPNARVGRVLGVVDVTQATVKEAIDHGVDLIVAHHPLLLRGVHSVAANEPKGALLHQLIRADIALYVAHTNADSAVRGVSDALANTLGLTDIVPLKPSPMLADQLVVFVPERDGLVDAVIDAIDDAAGSLWGDYTRCAFSVTGTGTFTPGPTTNPTIGERGQAAAVTEARVEMTIPRARRTAVIAALKAAHPYEMPAYHFVELTHRDENQGLGRVGTLATPVRFERFVAQVAAALPTTPAGVRGAGDPARMIQRVAVCGGAGDSLLPIVARANVDAYVTADLRHHLASEFGDVGGPALIDAGHWATERPWLDTVGAIITAECGANVEMIISDLVTDPWTIHSVKAGR